MRATGLLGACFLAAAGGCAATRPAVDPQPAPAKPPQEAFVVRLAEHCGKAFAGRIVANRPPAGTDPFAGKILVMHVRSCPEPGRPARFEIPFQVGDDRSRTWLLTPTASGLRLQHEHRHQDGSPDTLTMYGGDTVSPGTPGRQEFPADAASIAMFERGGLAASVDNVWAIEVGGDRFVYELSRPDGRLFRVEFDVTRPVPAPPAAWGIPD